MFENSSTDEVINFLEPLIPDRLSGKVFVDGVLIADTEAGAVIDQPVAAYDQWGFSSPDEFGCVRIQAVDDEINSWLADSDKFKRQIAAEQAQWFGILHPNHDLPEDVAKRVRQNTAIRAFASGYIDSIVFGNFRFFNPRYINLETGELKEELTIVDRRSRDWSRNRNYQGDAIPNHAAVSWGNFAQPSHPRWAERFVPGIALQVFDLWDRRLISLKLAEQRAIDGVVAPQPGGGFG